MFFIVAYDIADDRRRLRVHKVLKDFGRRVQYSTFECLLDPPELARLQHLVGRLIEPGVDAVAYYGLCEVCAGQTNVLGGPPRLQENHLIVI
jgi:CRISPR-associated protein Cas2